MNESLARASIDTPEPIGRLLWRPLDAVSSSANQFSQCMLPLLFYNFHVSVASFSSVDCLSLKESTVQSFNALSSFVISKSLLFSK